VAAANENCLAIDVFGDQHLNVDRSGFGDRDIFLQNLELWTGDKNCQIIQASSMTLSPSNITDRVGHCRLVSIDGGHNEDCVISDLNLIEAAVIDQGIVVIDDFFNQSWPGVASGGSRYFLDPSSRLKPFAVTPNKLYAARPAAHELYRSYLRKSQSSSYEKTVRMFDSDVDIFGCEERPLTLNSQIIKNTISRSPVGPYIRMAKTIFRSFLSKSQPT
jgi:hypothetical protein